jgi:hypothetical protein
LTVPPLCTNLWTDALIVVKSSSPELMSKVDLLPKLAELVIESVGAPDVPDATTKVSSPTVRLAILTPPPS